MGDWISASAIAHRGPIAGIAAHGELIATAGYDNQLILWDRRQRVALARASHDHLVNHCHFSADGRWLVSAASDHSARVWSVPSLRLHAVLHGHDDDVDMAVFSPDERHIATCALDRCVRIFARDGRCLHTLRGHDGNVLSLAWTADSRYLLSSSVDGTIRQWDAERGVALRVTDLRMRSDSVVVGPDGVVYAGDDRGRIAIIADGRVSFIEAHRAGVKTLALDARQGVLASLSYDRTLAVWRIDGERGLRALARTPLPATIWARAATILDDGRIATGTFGATYALFDPATLRWDVRGVAAGAAINAILAVEERVYTVGDAGQVRIDGRATASMGSLCNFLVAAGGRVLCGGQLGRLFDADSGELLYEHHSPLNCGVAFTRGGQAHLALGSYTGEILIFLFHGGRPRLQTSLRIYENAVKGLSVDAGLLFSVCASTDIGWHRIADWSLAGLIRRAHERIANACCALGGAGFASVGRDRVLRLWQDGAVDGAYDSPHRHSVKCVAVDAARTLLASGAYDGTVALFDLARRVWLPLARPTAAGIASIVWDDARRCFLAASYDGAVYAVAP